MPIKLRSENGKNAPIICCDECGKKIDNASLAGVLYKDSTDGEHDVFFFHKGKCDDALQKRFGGHTPWQELSQFLVYLTANVKLDINLAKDAVNEMADYGLGSRVK